MKLILLISLTAIALSFVEASKFTLLPSTPPTLVNLFLQSNVPKPIKPTKNFEVRPAVSDHWLDQRLDHFDPQNLDTFNQRYYLNEEFHSPSGPIFLYLHSLPYDPFGMAYLSFGPVFDLASTFNGTIVIPHHRYFLESVVFEELTTENMRFLSVSQALEDLAHLIVHLRSQAAYTESRVIIVGWDYGGSMATWFAQRYPHLVDGIWVSGARLNPQVGHDEPVERVEEIFRRVRDPACFARIENGFRQLDELFAANQSNVVRRRFNLCHRMPYTEGDFDISYLYQSFVSYFYELAQIYDDALFNENFCPEFMGFPVEEDWEAVGYLSGFLDIPFPLCSPNALEHWIELVRDIYMFDVDFNYAIGFLYLQCAEFGFMFDSGNGTSIFGSRFPREFFAHTCKLMFGFSEAQVTENFERFNTLHGGRRPIVRNAFHTVGELYQWRDQTIEPAAVHSSSHYEVVPGRALHTELSIIFQDPVFEEVRERAFATIAQWLGWARKK